MLVLSRKTEQSIRIGDSIEITVLEVRGGKVRLGVKCPQEIPVHREEIYRRIAAEATSGLEIESEIAEPTTT